MGSIARFLRSRHHDAVAVLAWSQPVKLDVDAPYWFACSSPVRELSDGSLILGLYHQASKDVAFGATVKSYDGGKTWKDQGSNAALLPAADGPTGSRRCCAAESTGNVL
jgi:hypothetical protein